jgi:hypothetical protein
LHGFDAVSVWLLTKAANRGSLKAHYWLSTIYMLGETGKIDAERAKYHLEQSLDLPMSAHIYHNFKDIFDSQEELEARVRDLYARADREGLRRPRRNPWQLSYLLASVTMLSLATMLSMEYRSERYLLLVTAVLAYW